MLLFSSGKTCNQHDARNNNTSFIRWYAPRGADGLIARVKRLDRTRSAPRDTRLVARGRVFYARTHAVRAQTHLSVRTALRDDTLWNLIPRHRLQVSYIFLFFPFIRPLSVRFFFHRKELLLIIIIIINYNTRRTRLTYRHHYWIIIIWH